mgnify:CR=1
MKLAYCMGRNMGIAKQTDGCFTQMRLQVARYIAGVGWQDGRSSSEVEVWS